MKGVILHEGSALPTIHKCDMPGDRITDTVGLYVEIKAGAIYRCSCGKLYQCIAYPSSILNRPVQWYDASLKIRWKYRNKGRELP